MQLPISFSYVCRDRNCGAAGLARKSELLIHRKQLSQSVDFHYQVEAVLPFFEGPEQVGGHIVNRGTVKTAAAPFYRSRRNIEGRYQKTVPGQFLGVVTQSRADDQGGPAFSLNPFAVEPFSRTAWPLSCTGWRSRRSPIPLASWTLGCLWGAFTSNHHSTVASGYSCVPTVIVCLTP